MPQGKHKDGITSVSYMYHYALNQMCSLAGKKVLEMPKLGGNWKKLLRFKLDNGQRVRIYCQVSIKGILGGVQQQRKRRSESISKYQPQGKVRKMVKWSKSLRCFMNLHLKISPKTCLYNTWQAPNWSSLCAVIPSHSDGTPLCYSAHHLKVGRGVWTLSSRKYEERCNHCAPKS